MEQKIWKLNRWTEEASIKKADYRGFQRGTFIACYENKIWEIKNGIVRMPCPFCDGYASLKSNFSNGVIHVVYLCSTCHESFTTNEIDDINILPLLNKKRTIKNLIEIVNTVFKNKIK